MAELPQKVLVARRIPEVGLDLLSGLDVEVLSEEDPPPRTALLRAVRGASGILTTLTERVDAEVLDAAGPSLEVVANMAVGYDNIDVAAAEKRGVIVTNTPGVLDETTADTAFMLMLAAARRLGEAERMVRAGRWRHWGPELLVGLDVWGKTLGIVGMGRIGQAVARRARGFGMSVLYTARSSKAEAERELGARRVHLEELLAESDFVSLHVPLTPQTHRLIGSKELRKMKSTSVLVNTARGPVVDEEALAEALAEGRIFAAGLDVYENEPGVHPKLLELENVVLAPHIGSASIETRNRMAEMAARNLLAVLRGEEPPNPVVTRR
ncbi:2-hydroxyacid dehydrogenase [Rubrobacter calidifluminis]|uniref:2-hydroxyacid dehydrogenase n=1 Tax=Rubrobacter calidifluminis TaxID=1392640 RepID=UPI00236147DE|nr:D-glycerate dehydrogenase [Rubrobacter calidifluminis]